MPFRLTALAPAARPASSSSSSTGRRVPPPRLQHPHRFLHATPPRRDAEIDRASNHYETLKVAPSATPAEIKRSFYNLSKTHHPDQSADPRSSERFVRISEAYNTLSSAERRARYDRDVLGLSAAQQQHHHRRGGSYSSTSNPAGGRPASGLSKRRTAFRGPPPSFYRSGGWGAHSDKRRKAHEESTGGAAAFGQKHSTGTDDPGAGTYSPYGGMGPGGDPFGHREEVPHFDKASHTRTHVRQDQRRAQRGRRALNDDDIEFEPQTSLAGHFLIVSGILVVTFLAPLVYLQFARTNRRKREGGM